MATNSPRITCIDCGLPGDNGQHKERPAIKCPDCGAILLRPF